MSEKIKYYIGKFFKDENGKVVLSQSPNLPLWIWIVTKILQLFISTGQGASVLAATSFGALSIWALLELFQGDTYFRRFLGFMVIINTVISYR